MSNNPLYTAKLHWVLFLAPAALGMLTLLLYSKLSSFAELAFFLFTFTLLWFFFTWIHFQFSFLMLKKKQISLRTGLFNRKTIDIPINKIESVHIQQSILGSLLRYGCLTITGTGGTQHKINFLDKPLTCRRHIEQLLE